MEDRATYYRKMAAEAQSQAERATNPEDKVSWLRLVNSWLGLLPKTARTPSEQFDDQARSDGTHQDVSKREQ